MCNKQVENIPSLRFCLCGNQNFKRVFSYDEPLDIEVKLRLADGVRYYREYRSCTICGHYTSFLYMDLSSLYEGDYVDGTYGGSVGMKRAFDKIINLPPEISDNTGRCKRINEFADHHFGNTQRGRLLDVGAGLGVFPYEMKKLGWDCLALDPDPRAVEHIQNIVGVVAIASDFFAVNVEKLNSFGAITFNKVLEHVEAPIMMLKKAKSMLRKDGFIYIEVPDVAAAQDGKEREEFTVDHYHVFSPASLALMIERSGLKVINIERLVEPSGKFTLRAFCLMSDV